MLPDDDTRPDDDANPATLPTTAAHAVQSRATVNRDARLLAFLLAREVVTGKRILDTKVDIADGTKPFDATCEVIAAMCDTLDRQSVEVALLLQREAWNGTVEALLRTAAYLVR